VAFKSKNYRTPSDDEVVFNTEIAALMKQFLPALIFVFALFACGGKKEPETKPVLDIPPSALSGEVLAAAHCARCHSFVDPGKLPRSSWKNDVLPSMGHRLGIYKGDHQPDSLFGRGVGESIIRQANIYPEHALIAKKIGIKLWLTMLITPRTLSRSQKKVKKL